MNKTSKSNMAKEMCSVWTEDGPACLRRAISRKQTQQNNNNTAKSFPGNCRYLHPHASLKRIISETSSV